MPNICRNNALITGNLADVSKFMDTITKYDEQEIIYDFTQCNPIPKELDNVHQGSITIDGVRCDAWYEDEDGTTRPMLDMTKAELIEKYGTYEPIDWQYDYWGTKWGDMSTQLVSDTTTDGKRTVHFWFESAWGQPYMLLHDIATQYNLTITNTFVVEFEEEETATTYPIKNAEEIFNGVRKDNANMRMKIRSS